MAQQILTSTKRRASHVRLRVALLAPALALAVCAFAAPAAWAEATNTVNFSCSSVKFNFTGFPNANNNTVHEVVYVDGVAQGKTTFTFNGPKGSNSVPVSMGAGHHKLGARTRWNTTRRSRPCGWI